MTRYAVTSVPIRRHVAITVCLVALTSLHPEARAQGPNEQEMCGAIAAKFGAVNENLRQTKKLCEQRAFRNDPLLAMQCLQQYGASGGTGNMAVRITRCEKIACEKASSQAGYVCDYVIGMAMPGNAAMRGSLGAMASNGSLGQGRFVRTGNRWLFIPLRQ